MWGRATYGALSATLKFRNVAMFDFPLMAKHHISLISLLNGGLPNFDQAVEHAPPCDNIFAARNASLEAFRCGNPAARTTKSPTTSGRVGKRCRRPRYVAGSSSIYGADQPPLP
jgi:hypothetical protein